MLGLESELHWCLACCREGQAEGVSCKRERYVEEGKGLNKYRMSLIRAALHSQEDRTGFPAHRLVCWELPRM